MKFINKTNKNIRVRVNSTETNSGFKWVDVYPDNSIKLGKSTGLAYGLTPVSEVDTHAKRQRSSPEQSTNARHEEIAREPDNSQDTEEQSKEHFFENVKAIKGIGEKTAQDIINAFDTEHDLQEAIEQGKHLPFRNDVEKKLKKHYS